MNKLLLGCGAIIGIILLVLFLIMGTVGGIYNGIQVKNQAVQTAWSNVESQYQRRYDLIPNFVNSVKAAANFEKSTLTEIAEARASVGRVKIDPTNITPDQLAAFQTSQQGLAGALSKLLIVTENYPDLKANVNFQALQAELAGTENRIAVKRGDFNETTQDYNTFISRFPASLLANFFGYHTKPYFKSDEKANSAPVVDFGN